MTVRKTTLRKLVLGLVLVVLAGLATVVIHDLLARKNPEAALPEFKAFYSKIPPSDGQSEATIEYTQLPVENTSLGAYSWRFLLENAQGGTADTWRELSSGWVNPGTAMRFEFTRTPQSVKVYRSHKNSEFELIEGPLRLPGMPGTYTYRIEGDWGYYGSVTYYFQVFVISMG